MLFFFLSFLISLRICVYSTYYSRHFVQSGVGNLQIKYKRDNGMWMIPYKKFPWKREKLQGIDICIFVLLFFLKKERIYVG